MCATKAEIRTAAISRRDALTADQRAAAGARIADRLRALPAYQQARCVLLYVSMRSEVDTFALLDELLAARRGVCVPVTDWAARRLDLFALTDRAELAPGRYGVPEPRPETRRPVDPSAIDLALVPGVAFDPCGRRLGYGAGLFDGLLPRLPVSCPRWGLAFAAQMVDELPADPHDQRVDAVITEDAIWRVEEGRDE
jgi:5-formyltetrahydrofolate cyclo-ligase